MTVSELLLLRILLSLTQSTYFRRGSTYFRSLILNTIKMTSVAHLILWYMRIIYSNVTTQSCQLALE